MPRNGSELVTTVGTLLDFGSRGYVIRSHVVTSLGFAIDILIGIASANQGSEGAPYVIVGETGFGKGKQIRELTLPPRSLEVQRLVLSLSCTYCWRYESTALNPRLPFV